MASCVSEDAPDRVILSVMAKYDKDGSKTISAVELGNLLYDLGFFVSKESLPAIMKEIDEDGSGKIEQRDFVAWWKSKAKFARLGEAQLARLQASVQYFQYFDADRKGTIDAKEWNSLFADLIRNKLVPSSLNATGALKQVDKDNSGFVSFNEFMTWMDKLQQH